MVVSNSNLLFHGSIFRFHVCFGGCIKYFTVYLPSCLQFDTLDRTCDDGGNGHAPISTSHHLGSYESWWLGIPKETHLVGGWTTQLKNMKVKLDHFPRDQGENEKSLKQPDIHRFILASYHLDSSSSCGTNQLKGFILTVNHGISMVVSGSPKRW